MNIELIQQIFEQIEENLPQGWQKMALRFEDVPNVKTSIKYYVSDKDGYKECFETVKDIRTLYPALVKIKDLLIEEKKKLSAKEQWTVFTLLVDSEGDFNAYYDYNYNAENQAEYEKAWEQKYLK